MFGVEELVVHFGFTVVDRLLGTVLDELERRDLNTALVTLCIGAGMGTATIIERV